MTDKDIFSSASSSQDMVKTNQGGMAFQLKDKAALAQYALTGVFKDTFYTTAIQDFEKIKELTEKLTNRDDEYIAKLALYARKFGNMKDMPAYLLAVLSTRNIELTKKIFNRVITNGKMLRTFCQIIRSGQAGRKSFGSGLKNVINLWLNTAMPHMLLNAIGTNPSLKDIISMTHPKPIDEERKHMFAYFLNKEYDVQKLPEIFKQYILYKLGSTHMLPKVDFRLLTYCNISADNYVKIAYTMPWNALRMNINHLHRKGVFNNPDVVAYVANKLKNKEEIKKYNVFPFDIYNAYFNLDNDVPEEIKEALVEALEIACSNVPSLTGNSIVFLDISGSMNISYKNNSNGYGGIKKSKRNINIAAIFVAAIVRNNPNIKLMFFNGDMYDFDRNHVMLGIDENEEITTHEIFTNNKIIKIADAMSKIANGGTNTKLCFDYLEYTKEKHNIIYDNVIIVSDNETASIGNKLFYNNFIKNYQHAKILCLDVNPNWFALLKDSSNILNMGGYSDQVFTVMDKFFSGDLKDYVVGLIESTVI